VNTAYAKANKPLLYGIGTDDSHNYHLFGPTQSNAGRGWVMVHAAELTAASLIEAMESGDFYASTGVTLKSTTFSEGFLAVEVAPEPGVKYKIEFISLREDVVGKVVRTVGLIDNTTARIKVTPDDLFVRARITSDKKRTNPVEEVEYEMAWLQPVRPK